MSLSHLDGSERCAARFNPEFTHPELKDVTLAAENAATLQSISAFFDDLPELFPYVRV